MSFPKVVWMVFGVLLKTVKKSNFPLWSQKAGAPGGRPGRYPEFSRRFSRACRARFSSSLAPTGPSPSRDLPRWAATMDRTRREVLTEVGIGKFSNSARTDGRMRGVCHSTTSEPRRAASGLFPCIICRGATIPGGTWKLWEGTVRDLLELGP